MQAISRAISFHPTNRCNPGRVSFLCGRLQAELPDLDDPEAIQAHLDLVDLHLEAMHRSLRGTAFEGLTRHRGLTENLLAQAKRNRLPRFLARLRQVLTANQEPA